MTRFLQFLEQFVRFLFPTAPSLVPPAPTTKDGPGLPPGSPQDDSSAPVPVPLPPEPPAPLPAPKYNWSTPELARHSLRIICDEEGLTVEQKNLMSQVVHCESGYHPNAKHPNLLSGKVVSTDFGICQWNDYYHSKEISPSDAQHDPEKAVRLMCRYVRQGRITQWVCYSSGLYRKYEP